MKEKRENMITEFIGDFFKLVIEIIILTLVTFVFVFLLAAPAFAPYFRGRYMGEFGCSENDERVKSKMVMVNIMLWTICICSWLFLIINRMIPPAGCGFAK